MIGAPTPQLKSEFHGNTLIQISETISLDAQGIGALQDAMHGRDFYDTDEYRHTDLRCGYKLGDALKLDGWHFVSSEFEDANYYREPRFIATVARVF